MKRILTYLAAATALCISVISCRQEKHLARYVDPSIGTERGGHVVADAKAFAFDAHLRPVQEEKTFLRVADGREAVRVLLAHGIPRHAVLEPLDDPSRPVRAADVQVCDQGAFKLVCLAAMGEAVVRRVRLRLNLSQGESSAFSVRDVSSGRKLSCGESCAWRIEDLKRGIEMDLPPQERVVLAIEATETSSR